MTPIGASGERENGDSRPRGGWGSWSTKRKEVDRSSLTGERSLHHCTDVLEEFVQALKPSQRGNSGGPHPRMGAAKQNGESSWPGKQTSKAAKEAATIRKNEAKAQFHSKKKEKGRKNGGGLGEKPERRSLLDTHRKEETDLQ